MPAPCSLLTAQELIYAASALRAEARRAERQAADPTFHASRQIFEGSARVYDELAGKLDRIAKSGAALHWRQCGSLPEHTMNWAYERAQKYAHEAMRNFASLQMTAALRDLIHSQITLAYTTASNEAWQEARAAAMAAIAIPSPGERQS